VNRILVGTAGHIDHGKSAIVKALTGTDPDRLPEEQARGITIDLGFAHATWDGIVFSFVDVPGHEKFVRTMVAGAQGVDLVLLAVASDDSVMPQTREHLAILQLLGTRSGILVRTKSDLADAGTGEVVDEEIRSLVAGTFLERAPLVAVSALTGAGIPELRRALAAAAAGLDRPPREGRITRLFVDRSFTMKGFGPVVTGTLDGGSIAVEDRLTLFPEGLEVRVRRLEVHGEERKRAAAGERVSLNLAGVERTTLHRGQSLVEPGALAPSSILTAEVTVLRDAPAPLRDGLRLRIHHGTADIGAKLALLPVAGREAKEIRPGETAYAQLLLETPIPAKPGDRFVLRRPSPVETLGGGRVLDAGRGRTRPKAAASKETAAALALLAGPDEEAKAELLLREAGLAGLTAPALARRLGIREPAVKARIDALASAGLALRLPSGIAVHASAATEMSARCEALFAERKKSGAPSLAFSRSEFLEKLGRGLTREAVEGWIAALEKGKRLSVSGDRISPPGAAPGELSPDAQGLAARLAEAFRNAGFEPPKSAGLAPSLGAKPQVLDGLTAHLLKEGVLVRISPDLVVHRDVLAAAEKKLLEVKGQTLPVAAFRDLWGLTRKTLIPLLEYFDGKKRTRRVGDLRKVE
jgi:selenocysteine-specific elongation factor